MGSARCWLLSLLLPGCVFNTTGLRPPARDDASRASDAAAEPTRGDRTPRDRPVEGTDRGLSCPPGFIPCAGLCVDVRINREHCGECGKACAPGLDCNQGKCECIQGGDCKGCCEANLCHAFSVEACAANGAPCVSCDDNEVCTTDTCEAGSCRHEVNTVACNDGLFCTIGDACSGGQCKGTPRTCPGNSCNTGACDEAKNTCTLTPKPDGTKCGPQKKCFQGKCQDVPP